MLCRPIDAAVIGDTDTTPSGRDMVCAMLRGLKTSKDFVAGVISVLTLNSRGEVIIYYHRHQRYGNLLG